MRAGERYMPCGCQRGVERACLVVASMLNSRSLSNARDSVAICGGSDDDSGLYLLENVLYIARLLQYNCRGSHVVVVRMRFQGRRFQQRDLVPRTVAVSSVIAR